MTHPTLRSRSPRWTLYAMLAVLLLASYLRIHGLNDQGLWGDEGWSIWLARGSSLRDVTLNVLQDQHGPVFSVMLHAWNMIAGPTVLGLRWLTVMFSIASIALIYLVGRTLFSPAAGVGAALAFALMDKQVVLTQEVRDYPIIYLTMMAIVYFYARWRQALAPGSLSPSTREGFQPDTARQTEKLRGSAVHGAAFGFVFFSVVGLYLQYYCAMANLAVLAHALVTLRDRRAWKHFLALNALIALAFLPWTMVVLNQFINTPVNPEVLTTRGLPFNRATVEYLATESFGKPVAIYAMLMLVGALGPLTDRLPGLMMRIPRDRRLSGALLAMLWFGVPIVFTWALHTRYPLLTDRNISVIMPAIALLVGLGLTAFEHYGALWVTALVVVNGLLVTSAYYIKPPWRQMAADIAAAYPSGEPVLVDVEGEHAALWYHLSLVLPVNVEELVRRLPREAEGIDPTASLFDLRERYQANFVPHLQKILAGTDGTWLAYWGDVNKKHDVFDVLAAEGFVRTATLPYTHHGYPIYAYRYDRASALENTLARFGDSITLRRAAWPATVRPGESFSVLLWWAADASLPQDYTVSAFLLDGAGVLRAQRDSYPAGGSAPTSGWMPGAFVFDAHRLTLPRDLAPGEYTVGVKLYTWWDGAILRTADDAEYYTAGTITVK
jgi:mannosyltransferase